MRAECTRFLSPHASKGDLRAMRPLGRILTEERSGRTDANLAEGRRWLRAVAARTELGEDLVSLAVALEPKDEERKTCLLRASEQENVSALLLLAEDSEADPSEREAYHRRALALPDPENPWRNRARKALDTFLSRYPHLGLASDESPQSDRERDAPTRDLCSWEARAVAGLLQPPRIGELPEDLAEAEQALAAGDRRRALALSRACLRRVPGDPNAHTIAALALVFGLLDTFAQPGGERRWQWARRHLELARITPRPNATLLLTSAVLDLIELHRPTSLKQRAEAAGRARINLGQIASGSPHRSRALKIEHAVASVLNSP